MPQFRIEPLTPGFVGMVRGLDLGLPLDPATRRAIEQAIWSYAVLVFPGQSLTQEQQVAFTAQFGPLYAGKQMAILRNLRNTGTHPAASDISNVDSEGSVVSRTAQKALMTVANQFWHTDASYEEYPFRYSVLAAVRLPARGGETQFADLRAAHDSLGDDTKRLVAGRCATFYSHHTRHALGIEDSEALLRDYPPVRWPILREHPETGRRVLWIDSRTIEISGMSVPEGRALAHELLEHIGQREHVYTHRWTPGDVVMWDNRLVLHRVRRFDLAEAREMRRVATVDDRAALGGGRFPEYAGGGSAA